MRSETVLRRERLELAQRSRPLIEKLGDGKRLGFEERATLTAVNADILEIDTELQRMSEGREASNAAGRGDSQAPSAPEDRAFTEYLRSGKTAGLQREERAAGEGTNSAGGFLVPPGWWQRLQVALKAYGGIANDFAQLETDTGNSMIWATNDPTSTAATLVAENTQLSAVDYVFGQGSMNAYLYANGVQLVSRQLAQDSAFDLDNFVQSRCGEALGRAQAAAAISGTGSSQPLGIITALNTKGAVGSGSGGFLGLTTSQPIVELSGYSTTATEVGANTLAPSTIIRMVGSIDRAYRLMGAKWYFNETQILGLRAQVDTLGRPLYEGLQNDFTPTLLGYPVVIDQNIPNLAASTTGGPVFGHLESAMVLRTVKGGTVLRLEERYADFLQVGFIGFQRFDIRSNDMRAAVTVKPSTA